jgi:L-rhamnose isomerase/sugar isomerase
MTRTAAHSLVSHPIEIPSWTFRGSDPRFSGSTSAGAPRSPYEMLADAAAVHRFTGVTPCVGLYLPADSTDDYADLARHAGELGLTIGSVHPEVNLRQGRPPGVCHPDEAIRTRALDQLLDGVEVAAAIGARRVTLRFVDDSPYPGHRELRARQERLASALATASLRLQAGLRLVIEYTVVEPCFYTMDVPDWGTAYAQSLSLGPAAQVLVDTGTYAQGRNPEFVGDLLAREGRLGGVVLRSPDDDTADPFDLFVVATEISRATLSAEVPFTLDPGANTAPGVLSAIRSVLAIQTAAARASVLDGSGWQKAIAEGDRYGAHSLLMDAYAVDPAPLLAAARDKLGVAADPLAAYQSACLADARLAERRAAADRVTVRRAAGQPRLGSWRPTPRRFAGSLSVAADADPQVARRADVPRAWPAVANGRFRLPVHQMRSVVAGIAGVAGVAGAVGVAGGVGVAGVPVGVAGVAGVAGVPVAGAAAEPPPSRRISGWWWTGARRGVESFNRAEQLERATRDSQPAGDPPPARIVGRATVPGR